VVGWIVRRTSGRDIDRDGHDKGLWKHAADDAVAKTFPTVYALTVFDDGTGPALYAGGEFTTAGGTPASYIAAWRCVMPRETELATMRTSGD
jgi:hypothetical protein